MIPLLRLSYGLEYSQLGADTYKLDYIGIPIAVKAKIGPVTGLVGSGINFKISEPDKADGADSFTAYDVPVFVGLGFNILFLGIDARYQWGLTDLEGSINNESFQIGLSARF